MEPTAFVLGSQPRDEPWGSALKTGPHVFIKALSIIIATLI